MGTKNNPGDFDCYENADPDEPMFVLLARDADAPILVDLWASLRERDGEDWETVREARICADAMRGWTNVRAAASGKRTPRGIGLSVSRPGPIPPIPEPFWHRSWRTLHMWRPECIYHGKRFRTRDEYDHHWLTTTHADDIPQDWSDL